MGTRQDLSVTRGDTLPVEIAVTDMSGEPVELAGGDVMRLTVKASTALDSPVLVQKEMTAETGCACELTCEDTSLPYGTYRYDVELETEDGRRFTVVPASKLKVTGEVTTHG